MSMPALLDLETPYCPPGAQCRSAWGQRDGYDESVTVCVPCAACAAPKDKPERECESRMAGGERAVPEGTTVVTRMQFRDVPTEPTFELLPRRVL